MRLLFLTSRLPYPPNRGDRLRAYHFIRSLSREYEVHLVSFITDEAEREYLAPLKEYCTQVEVLSMSTWQSASSVGANIWRRQPLQALYYRSAAMGTLIDRVIARTQFEAVYVHLFRMAPYVKKHDNLYRIIDLTDVISQELIRSMPYRSLPSRLIYKMEHPRIERYERWVANHYEETWLISEYDRIVLAADCPNANLQVVRNGVDVETLYPTNEPVTPNSLILVGHMGVFHNVDAATYLVQDILPLVWTDIPNVSVKLVGTAPKPEIQALGRVSGVEVTGFVPDLNAILNQSTVFVAPLRFAAGVQNKVLEAMAAGRPVITSSLVNQGLGAQDGRDLLVADNAKDTARSIVRLLREGDLRKELGASARIFVQRHYSWDLVLERMGAIRELLVPKI